MKLVIFTQHEIEALVIPLCVAVVLFLTCGVSWSQMSQPPGEEAKKEGELVWYTTTSLDTSKQIIDRFQKRYPFIKPHLYRTDVGPLINRILFEARVGRYAWDVVGGGAELFLPLMEKGLLASYRSPEAGMIDDDLVDRRGYWAAYTISTYALGFNTGLVKKGDVPRGYEALLDPKWKGRKIGLDSWGGMLHALIPVWEQEKAVSYFKQLVRQDPVVKSGNSLRVQLLAAGEFPLAIGLAHTIENMNRKGAAVDWVALEPAVVRVIAAMVAARAPHPNAGRLFLNFLLSKEVQEILRDNQRVPVRKDVEPDPPRLFRGYKRVIMYPERYRGLDETQRLYDEIFK